MARKQDQLILNKEENLANSKFGLSTIFNQPQVETEKE